MGVGARLRGSESLARADLLGAPLARFLRKKHPEYLENIPMSEYKFMCMFYNKVDTVGMMEELLKAS